MKVLIVGLGSIGRRHLSNVKMINSDAHVAIWRQSPMAKEQDIGFFGVDQILFSQEEAFDFAPDVALIASPAVLHMDNGLALAERGVDLLIEKPLAESLDKVDDLLALCQSRDVVLMVGYNLRFYEPLRRIKRAIDNGYIGRVVSLRAEVGQYLPNWRPESDYRQSVSAQQKLGGGVVLELSHEIDYARWLVGEVASVSAVTAKLGDLDIDVEDTAEIIFEFSNGAIGSIHLDMLQRVSSRSCRVIGTEGTITWDIRNHQVQVYRAGSNVWDDLHPATAVDMNDTYKAELEHFFFCVKNRCNPDVSGADGRKAVELVLAIKESASRGHKVCL